MDKKNKIILAAVAEFAKDGFEKASIDTIALKAKVAKGTVFYHFRSKQELFEKIVEEGQQKFDEIISKKTKDLKSEKDKVKMAVEIEVDFVHRYHDLFSVYLNNIIKKINSFKIFEDILRDGIEKGEFRNDLDVSTTAVALFWMTAMTALNSKKVDKTKISDLIMKGILK